MIIHCDTSRFVYEVLEQGEYSFLFDNLVVVDAGCNIGTFSLWIQPRAKMIHAIDMEESHLSLFKQTIKDNKFKNITLYNERLLDMGGFMSSHTIPFVDVLKVDIEGDEIELFQKGFPVQKIRTIIGEYHGRPVKQILEDLGYHYHELPNYHFMARL